MFNFILAIPAAILKFLAAIVYIPVVIAFYPFVVIGKLSTTYYKDRKIYNNPLTEDDKTDMKNRHAAGWKATKDEKVGNYTYISYDNESEYNLAGADRELKEEELILLVVRTVQFIGYTVSFPVVLSYCLLFESTPKEVVKFDGYRKSFRNCVYRHAWDCKDYMINMNKTIDSFFIEGKNNNTDGSNLPLNNQADTSVVSAGLNHKININLKKPKTDVENKCIHESKKSPPIPLTKRAYNFFM